MNQLALFYQSDAFIKKRQEIFTLAIMKSYIALTNFHQGEIHKD